LKRQPILSIIMASFGLARTNNHVSPTNQPIDSSTPWMAASEGNLALLQTALTALNLPLSAADENGYTLVHAAASYNKIAVLQHLLASGQVNVHAADNEGDSSLHYAGNVEACKLLVEVGQVNPRQANAAGKTALEAKQEELKEMMEDEGMEDDDEELEMLKGAVAYLSSLQ
jgi:ankyrin repeat protein